MTLHVTNISVCNNISHCQFEFCYHFPKFTAAVIKEFIEALPGGRVVMRGVFQPVREHSSAAIFIIHSLFKQMRRNLQ